MSKGNIDPFRLLLIGPSASGKTTLAKNLLMKQLRGQFDYVYLISPTNFQSLWKDVGIHKDRSFDTPDDTTFEKIIKEMEQQKNKNALIIVDDAVGTELTKLNSALCKHILKLRHHQISIMIMTQLYRGIPRICRVNMSHMAIFNVNNKLEAKTLAEEQAGFEEHFPEAVNKPYSYLWIDLTKNILDPDRFKISPY